MTRNNMNRANCLRPVSSSSAASEIRFSGADNSPFASIGVIRGQHSQQGCPRMARMSANWTGAAHANVDLREDL